MRARCCRHALPRAHAPFRPTPLASLPSPPPPSPARARARAQNNDVNACYLYGAGAIPSLSASPSQVSNLQGSLACLVLSGCCSAFIGAAALARSCCWRHLATINPGVGWAQIIVGVISLMLTLVGTILPVPTYTNFSATAVEGSGITATIANLQMNGPGMPIAIANTALVGLILLIAIYGRFLAAPGPVGNIGVTGGPILVAQKRAAPAAGAAPATYYARDATGAPVSV